MTFDLSFGSMTNTKIGSRTTINSNTMTAKRSRLLPEEKMVLKMYPSLENVSFFMRMAYKTMPKHTPEARVACAEIASAISKCISGIMYEFPIVTMAESELYLAKLKIFVNDIESNMMRFKNTITNETVISGGIGVQLTPIGLQALKEIQNWKLVENIVYNSTTNSGFNINNKLKELIENIRFV